MTDYILTQTDKDLQTALAWDARLADIAEEIMDTAESIKDGPETVETDLLRLHLLMAALEYAVLCRKNAYAQYESMAETMKAEKKLTRCSV